MKVLFTLDYEIFFGKQQGSVEDTILKPSTMLFNLAQKYNEKIIFFVDVGFLIQLRNSGIKHPKLLNDFKNICNQLEMFTNNGHSIQLHIHSHWENSYYNGENWELDFKHYQLQSFSQNEIFKIVKKYKNELEELTNKEVFAFRAGGWCIQPFDVIREALFKNNIIIDSSVINNSYSESFDFRKSPEKTFWNFNNDPSIEEKGGVFIEVPISSIKVYPNFYWNLLINKIMRSPKVKTQTDGIPMNPTRRSILMWLLFGNYTAVSSDGLKSDLLIKSLKNYEKKYSENDYFTTIGHPKTLNTYSLNKIEEFFKYIHGKHETIDYTHFRNMDNT